MIIVYKNVCVCVKVHYLSNLINPYFKYLFYLCVVYNYSVNSICISLYFVNADITGTIFEALVTRHRFHQSGMYCLCVIHECINVCIYIYADVEYLCNYHVVLYLSSDMTVDMIYVKFKLIIVS